MSIELVEELARETGGTITEVGALPDSSGFAVMSMPLPVDHWLIAEGTGLHGFNAPAMPFRTGNDEPLRIPEMTRNEFAVLLREAGKYALRCSTFNGKNMDFDPDAVLQNLVVGLIGYWTETGLSSDDFANPAEATQ